MHQYYKGIKREGELSIKNGINLSEGEVKL